MHRTHGPTASIFLAAVAVVVLGAPASRAQSSGSTFVEEPFVEEPFVEEFEPDPAQCSREQFQFCLDGVGSGVTSLDTLRLTGTRAARARGDAEQERAREQAALGRGGNFRGMSAGEGFLSEWTAWGSWAHSDYESDVAVAPYDAETDNLLVGLDRFWGDRFVVGLSLGYENTDTRTQFNGGDQESDGLTIAPYGLYIVNDVFSIDASVGYSALETDQTRIDPANGATLTSDFDADRAFLSANLNAVYPTGNWVLGGRAGLLHTFETQDAYLERGGPSARAVAERDLDLTQALVGVDVAYSLGAWEPYALVSYHNDLSRDDGSSAGGLPGAVGSTQPSDDDEVRFGAGVRYFGASGLTGSFEWVRTEGRSQFEDDTLTFTLRVPL